MTEPSRIVTVVLIIDDPDLANDMTLAVRGAGMDVERLPAGAKPDTHPRAVFLADRAAKDDRGVSLFRSLRTVGDDTPFVFIDPDRVARAEVASRGSRDLVFVIEPFDVSSMLECLRTRARNAASQAAQIVTEESIEIGDVVVNCGILDVEIAGKRAQLSTGEFVFIYELAKRRDRFVSMQELTEIIWGRRYVPGEKNISVTATHARQKLRRAVPDRTFLDFRKQVGYRFNIQPPTRSRRKRGSAKPRLSS